MTAGGGAQGDGSAGKATASAPANIAFVKYWGARDLPRALPLAPSISMTLESCRSRTTVEVLPAPTGEADEVLLAGPDGGLEPAPERFAARVHHHLALLRRWADDDAGDAGPRFRVATRNTFPAAAGLASSASGFAALAVAVARALGRDPGAGELSSLARRSGSGSAARSVLGGYVEWPAGGNGDGGGAGPDDPRAVQLAPASHWKLADVIALVEDRPKATPSLDGHRLAPTSPHFERRLAELPRRLAEVRAAIRDRDLRALGPVLEEEAIELHLIAMSSRPPVFYWQPGTLEVLAAVRAMRAPGTGLGAWATMDAGANVHVLCPAAEAGEVAERLGRLAAVSGVIRDRVGDGPALHDEHLF